MKSAVPASFAMAVLALGLSACEKKPNDPPLRDPAPKTVSASVPIALADMIHSAHAENAPAPASTAGVAWFDGDVDAAFAQARERKQPVLLHYGAVWCPPCNRLKATLFNRNDFIERTRLFVPVNIDGDTPDGQRLASRFKVSGYPTMVLLMPDGREITRIPGEVDASQVMQVLALGLRSARPIKEVLNAALAGRPLAPDDWHLLAYYAWDVDEHQALGAQDLSTTLQRLAIKCPPASTDARTRLHLKAIATAATAQHAARASGKVDKDARAAPLDRDAAARRLLDALSNPRTVRDNFDVMTGAVDAIVAAVTAPRGAERAKLAVAWDDALRTLASDATLSNTDRLDAVAGRVALAKLDASSPTLPDALIDDVRNEVARADRATTNPYERQTVINAAADALTEAGLYDDGNLLLEAELERSPAPYYFMSALAANAKKRGDAKRALDWSAKAYEASRGPATRLQWGAAWIGALIELAPKDEARIREAASRVSDEMAGASSGIDGRNAAVLERLGARLSAWSATGAHAGAVRDIKARFAQACAGMPDEAERRARCERALNGERAALASSSR